MIDQWTRVVMLATRLNAHDARKVVDDLPASVLNQFPCPPARDCDLARRPMVDVDAGRQGDDLETLLYLMSLDLFKS